MKSHFISHQNFMETSNLLTRWCHDNGTVWVPAAFHLLVGLMVGNGKQLPVTICLVRSHSVTQEFRTLPKILMICCFRTERGKITLCVLVQLELVELESKHLIASFKKYS